MADLLDNFTFLSVLSRLLLAAVAGGIVGYGRSKKSQAAGLRTYIICCVGSTLATLLAFYQYEMLTGPWNLGDSFKYDASRYSAAVISGIGFLAAGSIVSTIRSDSTIDKNRASILRVFIIIPPKSVF